VNRTDRLYALVEELRAVSPRPRTAAWLARRFEVSVRTVERDLDALRESGVAIIGDVGRSGGYSLERSRTLPPVTLTAGEALAIGVALRSVGATPFAAAARRAALKVLAVLPPDVRRREELLSGLIHRVGDHPAEHSGPDAEVIQAALAAGRVVHLRYTDGAGVTTERDVDPMALLWGPQGWYLMGWCRLRNGVRGFQLDRIASAELRDEPAVPHETELTAELERLDAERLRS
jgi:predicted DNA-binding transcriptional regulator YafY